MKSTYININTNILLAKDTDKVFNFLSKKLLECGLTFSVNLTSQGSFDQINSALNYSNNPLVFIIGDSNSIRNYSIKSCLSKYFKVQMAKNLNIVKSMEYYCKINNIQYKQEFESEASMPMGSIHLVNLVNDYQGFLLRNDGKVYIFLPNDLKSVEYIFNNQIYKYLNELLNSQYKVSTFKTFGICEKDLLILIKDFINNKLNILITTYADDLDITINVRYQSDLDDDKLQEYMMGLLNLINKYTYANENISLYKTALDLLKLTNKKLSILESSSLNNISKSFLECDDLSIKLLKNSIFSTKEDSLIDLTDLNKTIIDQYGLISVETTYEISVSLLQKYKSDLVLCTWGDIPQDYSMSTIKCYIAVGDNDGIHVYKNIFTGSKESIVKNISKSSIFYLIKKIKQNDLFFNQTIV